MDPVTGAAPRFARRPEVRYLTRKSAPIISRNFHKFRTARRAFAAACNAWETGDYCYNGAPESSSLEQEMSDQPDTERKADGKADAIAAVSIIAVVVYTAFFWLHGMPT
jgi:ribonuclease HII